MALVSRFGKMSPLHIVVEYGRWIQHHDRGGGGIIRCYELFHSIGEVYGFLCRGLVSYGLFVVSPFSWFISPVVSCESLFVRRTPEYANLGVERTITLSKKKDAQKMEESSLREVNKMQV